MFKNVESQNNIEGSLGEWDRVQGPSHELNAVRDACAMRRVYIKPGNGAVLAGKLPQPFQSLSRPAPDRKYISSAGWGYLAAKKGFKNSPSS